MNIPPLSTHLTAPEVPLDQLAGDSKLSESEKVGELSRQFESLLLRQILREANKTVIHSSLTEESATSGIYQDMVTNQLAESVSKSGAFGLAQGLKAELTRQLGHPRKRSIEN